MKKIYKLLLIIIPIILIGLIAYLIISYTFSDNIRFKREYEKTNNKYLNININKKNNIKYVNTKEALDVLEKGTGILYIGNPKSNKCKSVLPILLKAATEEEIDNIYYLNNLKIKKNSKEYKKLLSNLSDYIAGSKEISIPSFIFIMGGKIVDYSVNTTYSTNLNSKEKKELKKLYKKSINKIYGTCDESC